MKRRWSSITTPPARANAVALSASLAPGLGTAGNQAATAARAQLESLTPRGPTQGQASLGYASPVNHFSAKQALPLCPAPLALGDLPPSHAECETGSAANTIAEIMPPGQPRFPPVRPYARGSPAEISRLARNPSELDTKQAEFEKAIYAPSTVASQQSRARLWVRTAKSLGFEPYKLDPDMILKTTGLLWASGYRTAIETTWQAKRDYENKFGGVWTPELKKAMKDAERACTRGLGPPRQSIPYPVARLGELPALETPRVPGGPCHPQRVDVCCCWLAYRGMEAEAARIGDVHSSLLNNATCVDVTLSVSKTDPGAHGVTRRHVCSCPAAKGADAIVAENTCPACAIKKQADWARYTFQGPEWSPLFPDSLGNTVTRAAFVSHIEAGFRLLGVATISHTGSCLVGEHSFRNGIASFLAAQRIEVWLIQGLLRHSYNSQTILGYIREAHIMAATDLAEQALLARDMGAVRTELKALQNQTAALKNLSAGSIANPTQSLLPILDVADLEDRNSSTSGQHIPSAASSAAAGCASNPSRASFALEEQSPEVDLTYIVPRPLYGKHAGSMGKIHTIDPRDPGKSLCGWRFGEFSNSEGHIFSSTPFASENSLIEGASKCLPCTRCEEQLSL